MKRLFCLFAICAAIIITLIASSNVPETQASSETLTVECMLSSELESPSNAEQTEYSFTLTCPNCNKLMSAKIKKWYTSSTVAKCDHCYKRCVIKYNWPSDHKEPTIREIKESK